jgi:selenocysteine-specific elongation factor
MRHVVFGTAGHIDHGKTTLVKALTGIDCDRLPEEQQRGITIELGFAQLQRDDLQIHFVDVPGHERLVHTMIAGAAGIDLALLVVAADESIMPQTAEHLEVIRLMGVPGGAVALTKIDLVDEELAELAVEEVRDLLAGTPFADAPVVPVSAHTGAGVEELVEVLLALAQKKTPRQLEDRPFRQAVDRVFSLAGAGTVVTGTSLWGRLASGSEVEVSPSGLTARVRRLHVHGEERNEVEAGERVALNLAGLATDQLHRGDQIIAAGPWKTSQLITVNLELLETAPSAVDEDDEVEVHALAGRVAARIDRLAERPLPPGGRTIAQISLRQPALFFPGDRVILRRPAPVNTFAGGMVLDAHRPRVRRRDADRLLSTPSVSRRTWPEMLEGWILEAGLAAITAEELAGRLGVLTDAVEAPLGRVLERQRCTTLPSQPVRLVAVAALEKLDAVAADELKRRLAGEEVSAGIPSRDFAAGILPRPAQGLADVYLEALRERRIIGLVAGRVVPPGTDGHMSERGKDLVRRVDALYLDAGLDPPAPGTISDQIDARPATIEGVCKYLVQRERLVLLDGKFLIHSSALDEVARQIRDWSGETFTVGQFKERFGLTRKLAIPILEWLDSARVTVRSGSDRKVISRPT